MYARHIQVYRGIDNALEFKLLNADQKPITTLANYTIKFQAFDENNSLIIEHLGVIVNAATGLFKVIITENDLLNVKQQYLSYNVHLVDSNSDAVLTYSNSHFDNSGIIYVSSKAFPGPRATWSVESFLEENDYWRSSTITAEPGINGNEALHTAALYTNGYVGNIIVQATLDDQVSDGTNWADVSTLTLDGTETAPTPVNFNGVFNHLRFKANVDPANTITKILVRN